MGIEPGTLLVIYSNAFLTGLTLPKIMRLPKDSYGSHATKVQKLNIPQLTLVKSAQSERHKSGSQEASLEVTFYCIYFVLYYISNTKMPTLPTLCNHGKTRKEIQNTLSASGRWSVVDTWAVTSLEVCHTNVISSLISPTSHFIWIQYRHSVARATWRKQTCVGLLKSLLGKTLKASQLITYLI